MIKSQSLGAGLALAILTACGTQEAPPRQQTELQAGMTLLALRLDKVP